MQRQEIYEKNGKSCVYSAGAKRYLEKLPKRLRMVLIILVKKHIRLCKGLLWSCIVSVDPHMGSGSMDGTLSEYVKKYFPDSKSDLFAVFIERCGQMAKENRYQAMITQHAWMFLSSFEKLREKLLLCDTINMAHLGARAFEEIGGEVVQTTSFVFRKSHIKDYKGVYCRLIEPTTQNGKEEMFLSGENRYESVQDNFSKIPGSPIAYWINPKWFIAFDKNNCLRNTCIMKKGMSTGDNARFIMQWFEVSILNTMLNAKSTEEAIDSGRKWFPITAGGERKKWYGNRSLVVNWMNDGTEMKANATILNHGGHWSRYIVSPDLFFSPHIAWSAISTSQISVRTMGNGFAFNSAAMAVFGSNLDYIMGLINSKVARNILELLAPTINFGVEQVGKIPIIYKSNNEIESLVNSAVEISKIDWDSFETSWDFKTHPLITYKSGAGYADVQIEKWQYKIADAFRSWESNAEAQFNILKANEEELNRIFIDIYGLQDELTPEVEDKDVTVRKADLQRDIKSFISYAVGCMFGRYSHDVDGLVYAGGNFDEKYCRWMEYFGNKANDEIDQNGGLVHGGWAGSGNYHYDGVLRNGEWIKATYAPDTDNIIPICDDEYFDDDIVGRFVKFVATVYGADTLDANLHFIADALGGKGSPKEVIRNYFLNDFYADHLKIYQKRPIYWLFDSGKKGGFKALIYMHRYQPDTIARMRTDYVHEQQARYRTAIADLEHRISGAGTSERVKLQKELTKIQDQDTELRTYEEKIHHLADQMIRIDLDDGVKHNYAIFQDVLAPLK